jgi:hypothetical protein
MFRSLSVLILVSITGSSFAFGQDTKKAEQPIKVRQLQALDLPLGLQLLVPTGFKVESIAWNDKSVASYVTEDGKWRPGAPIVYGFFRGSAPAPKDNKVQKVKLLHGMELLVPVGLTKAEVVTESGEVTVNITEGSATAYLNVGWTRNLGIVLPSPSK